MKTPSYHPADPSSNLGKNISGLLKEWAVLKKDLCYFRVDHFIAIFVLELDHLKIFWEWTVDPLGAARCGTHKVAARFETNMLWKQHLK